MRSSFIYLQPVVWGYFLLGCFNYLGTYIVAFQKGMLAATLLIFFRCLQEFEASEGSRIKLL
jgi:hypothetical protein